MLISRMFPETRVQRVFLLWPHPKVRCPVGRWSQGRASCRRFNFFYGSLQMRIFVTRKNRHGVEAPCTTIGRSWQPSEKGPHKSSSYGMKGMLPSESIRKTLQLSVKCKELLRPPPLQFCQRKQEVKLVQQEKLMCACVCVEMNDQVRRL